MYHEDSEMRRVPMPRFSIQHSPLFDPPEVGRETSMITTVKGTPTRSRLVSDFEISVSSRGRDTVRQRLSPHGISADHHVKMYKRHLWQKKNAKVAAIVCPSLPGLEISYGLKSINMDCRIPIKVEDVIRACCSYFGYFKGQMNSPSRVKSLVRARQVAMYLCATQTTKSTTQIGLKMGGRDHSTVVHGIQKIKDRLAAHDEDVTEAIRVLSARLDALSRPGSVVPALSRLEGRE